MDDNKLVLYSKLIRDRIPDIIEAESKLYSLETMSEAEYLQALREKLIEEAQETAQASPESLVMELADLFEVMDALMAAQGLEISTVRQIQAKRREKRGGFEKRLRLLWVEEKD